MNLPISFAIPASIDSVPTGYEYIGRQDADEGYACQIEAT